MATAAMAAKAKATVEARYVIALQPQNRRQFDVVRQSILSACKRSEFAESARYKKPVGGGTIEGFSIRFAEEAIKAMKNISVESTTIYEDDSIRTVQINVTDLENNICYGKEISVAKTVERKSLKTGQVPISKRENSNGQITYLVEATEDEIANKIASAESKIIRNCGLRLVPSDILEEAEQEILRTLETGGADPKAAIKKLSDAFAMFNVSVSELAKYLGHPLETTSPKEIADLRAIYTTIKDGTSSWADYQSEPSEKATKPAIAKKKTETAPAQTTTIEVTATTAEEDNIDTYPETPSAAEPTAEAVKIGPSTGTLIEFARTNEIDWNEFKRWFANTFGRKEAEGWADWNVVPEADAAIIINEPKKLKNIKLICGKN